MPRTRPRWLSAALALGATAAVTTAIVGFVSVRDPDSASIAVDNAYVRAGGACGASAPQPPVGPSPGPRPSPAPVSIPGATEVDLGGAVVTDIVAGDGQAWASVVEPDGDPTAPTGRLARIDAGAGALIEVVQVVEGCSISALTLGDGGVWAGTCDALAAPDAAVGSGQVVEVDPVAGDVVSQTPLPASCIDEVTAGAGSVSAGALTGDTTTIWRVDPVTAAVTETGQLVDEALGGLAATADGLWAQELGGDGDEAVRADPESGQEQASVPEDDAVLVGAHGDGVWFLRPDAIVQRDAATTQLLTETPRAGARTVAVGATGAWFEQVTPGSTAITIGRIDPTTGAVTFTLQFESAGVDRSGQPFGVDLAADETGVWLVHQGQLFRLALPSAPAPETLPPPSATPTPGPGATTTTTAPATTTVPASSTLPASSTT